MPAPESLPTIVAWHNEPGLKRSVVARLKQHQRLDQIAQHFYWEDGRGCHLGCLTHDNTTSHKSAERLFGIERRIGYWLEAVFEGLPKSECANWVIDSSSAIPVGADLSLCHHHFGLWLLGDSKLLTITDGNRKAIETVRSLHERAAGGDAPTNNEWSAAESAARSAARSARSAWSAAIGVVGGVGGVGVVGGVVGGMESHRR